MATLLSSSLHLALYQHFALASIFFQTGWAFFYFSTKSFFLPSCSSIAHKSFAFTASQLSCFHTLQHTNCKPSSQFECHNPLIAHPFYFALPSKMAVQQPFSCSHFDDTTFSSLFHLCADRMACAFFTYSQSSCASDLCHRLLLYSFRSIDFLCTLCYWHSLHHCPFVQLLY